MEPFLGYAANKSISAGSSKTADIDTAGNLKFSVKAVGASSGTRWKTVGLYVTSDPTGRNGKESTKAKDCVFFDKLPKGCSKKDETDRTGIVTTTFTISKDVFGDGKSSCDNSGSICFIFFRTAFWKLIKENTIFCLSAFLSISSGWITGDIQSYCFPSGTR